MNLFRISVVSYLNSKPFIYGLGQSDYIRNHAVITTDNPAECANKVITGQSDLGLVPVAVLPEIGNYHIYSDYCIGAKGRVRSVFLYSDVPLHAIRKILADPQSRTSVGLTKVLAKYFWKIDPEWEKVDQNDKTYLDRVQEGTAAVMIGDRTFNVSRKFRYTYDLAEEWMLFTGLPFVFACWAGKKELPSVFIENFNNALEYGIENRDKVIAEEQKNYPGIDVKDYITNNITYVLDSSKRKALELFLSLFNKIA